MSESKSNKKKKKKSSNKKNKRQERSSILDDTVLSSCTTESTTNTNTTANKIIAPLSSSSSSSWDHLFLKAEQSIQYDDVHHSLTQFLDSRQAQEEAGKGQASYSHEEQEEDETSSCGIVQSKQSHQVQTKNNNNNNNNHKYYKGNISLVSKLALEYSHIHPTSTNTTTHVDEPQVGHIEEETTVVVKKEKKKKKKKKHKSDPSPDPIDTTTQLQGKVITTTIGTDSNAQPVQVMVLIDPIQKIVYSGLKRTNDGELIQVGIVQDNGEITITSSSSCVINDFDTSNDINDKDESKDSLQAHQFPYPTDEDDHCESPLNSYQDIIPILKKLDEILKNSSMHASSTLINNNCDKVRKRKRNIVPQDGTTKCDSSSPITIYDPYYCNGSVKRHLSSLGYPNVYNQMEDCYKTWSSSSNVAVTRDNLSSSLKNTTPKYPHYDVLITNPPYSGDHMERLIQHVISDDRVRGKTWCLLMPTFVHKKEYYKDAVHNLMQRFNCQPFYVIPKKRYVYIPPANFREKKVSSVHKKNSPFVSMWYIWGGTRERTNELYNAYQDWIVRSGQEDKCDLARTRGAIRDLRRKHS